MARRVPSWRRCDRLAEQTEHLLLSGLNSSSSATSAASITDAHRALASAGQGRIVLVKCLWPGAVRRLAGCRVRPPGAALANTVHYVLTARVDCTLFLPGLYSEPGASEPISGSFDVTENAVPADHYAVRKPLPVSISRAPPTRLTAQVSAASGGGSDGDGRQR